MKSFSERKGIKPVSEIIQTSGMSEELRNSLWNVLHVVVLSSNRFMSGRHGELPLIDSFSEALWFAHYKRPIDERPGWGYGDRSARILKIIRDRYFQYTWNEVYDFLEFCVRYFETSKLKNMLNTVLERELSGFRFVDDCLVDITDEQECSMLEEALADSRFAGVTGHLSRSLSMLSNRENPDYRNSIKESILAVEAMARILSGKESATLAEALKVLERSGKLHAALKDGFSKLYGYTSDEDGIRHAMLDEPNLTQADAKYFLISCTSFVNYLKSSMP